MKSDSMFGKLSLHLTANAFGIPNRERNSHPSRSDASLEGAFLTALEQLASTSSRRSAGDMTFADRVRAPTFFTFAEALKHAGLLNLLITKQVTIFAPTDEAFVEMGIYPWNIGELGRLNELLLYHLITGHRRALDLRNGHHPTYHGAAIDPDISPSGQLFIDEAQVIAADLELFDNVVHVLDQVLLPPMEELMEELADHKNLSIFRYALIKSGLVHELSPAADLTLWAPTNEAFIDFIRELGMANLNQLTDEILSQVIGYHLSPGRVYSSDFVHGSRIESISGNPIQFNLSEHLSIVDENRRQSKINADSLDLQSTNGVIHTIDTVLLPGFN